LNKSYQGFSLSGTTLYFPTKLIFWGVTSLGGPKNIGHNTEKKRFLKRETQNHRYQVNKEGVYLDFGENGARDRHFAYLGDDGI
jgi:hypothetical protein